MNIAVLGTGMVGRAIAGRLNELGHSVAVGTRDPQATSARTEPDGMGNPPFSTWHSAHPSVGLVTFAEAAAGADLVFNASSGAAALELLRDQELRARLGPASTQAAQHSKTMPQQIPVMPAHRSDRPASGPTRDSSVPTNRL